MLFMNELNRINNNIFNKSKNFKLFLIFYLVIFFFIIGSLFSYIFCFLQIENAINDEYNKVVNIRIKNNYEDFEDFYNINYDKFNDKVIDVYVDNVILFGDSFDIVTSEDDFDLENLAIRISNKYKNNKLSSLLGIKDFNIENHLDDDSIIYCNQLFSEKLLRMGNSGMISLFVKNYKDLDNILFELNDRNIDANLNKDINNNIIMYNKVQDILFIIIGVTLVLVLVVTIFQLIQLFYEQRKNLFIYKVIGLNLIDIIILYIRPVIFYTSICYFINLLLFYCIGNLFVTFFDNIFFLKYTGLIFLIIIIVNIIEVFIQVMNIRKGV